LPPGNLIPSFKVNHIFLMLELLSSYRKVVDCLSDYIKTEVIKFRSLNYTYVPYQVTLISLR
jgi:hypothetical protein